MTCECVKGGGGRWVFRGGGSTQYSGPSAYCIYRNDLFSSFKQYWVHGQWPSPVFINNIINSQFDMHAYKHLILIIIYHRQAH